MSAFDAPSGSVYENGRTIFVVLDGHEVLTVTDPDRVYRYRRALNLNDGTLTYFGANTAWDESARIA